MKVWILEKVSKDDHSVNVRVFLHNTAAARAMAAETGQPASLDKDLLEETAKFDLTLRSVPVEE